MVSPRLVELGERRRQEIVRLVGVHIREHGVSPTIAELAEALAIQPSAVRRHVNVLVEQGVLTQDAGKARTLRPVKKPKRKAAS